MQRRFLAIPAAVVAAALVAYCSPAAFSQPPDKGGKGGPGGFGPGGQQRELVKDFDKNGDGWLNKEERIPAREAAKKGGGKGPGGFGKGGEPGKPGPKVSPADVKNYPEAPLYDASVLRTIFIEFENEDWEAELQDFRYTDVEVPATVTIDGKKYTNVGIRFRGMSSYFGVQAGLKRSLNLSFDMADSKQRIYGYKTLNLLNSHGDPSMYGAVMYSEVARQFMPAAKANVVKVVINGESWGLYQNLQQIDKVFIKENYGSGKGTRWKVRGSPGTRAGLEYMGDDVAAYKRLYDMKGDEENPEAWKALIQLCKVLNQTPTDKLEEALKPIMDIDEVLKFLALDVALINCDGYWVRSSDYYIYLDGDGKFHILPGDTNEAFRPAMGPGMGGPGGGMFRLPPPGLVLPPPVQDTLRLTPEQKKELEKIQKEVDEQLEKLMTEEQRKAFKELKDRSIVVGPGGGPGPGSGRGLELDPLVGLDNVRTPLRGKLLAVPALKAKYLGYVKSVAEKGLDWEKLAPVVSQYRKLIEKEVEIDTRKLDSFEAFKRNTSDNPPPTGAGPGGGRGSQGMNYRVFAEERQKYLLNHPEVKKVGQ